MVVGSRRGQALARLLPGGVEGWVPEHFYAEVLAVVRRRLVIDKTITDSLATVAVGRLCTWPLHRASIAPLVDAAWAYRHNMSAADALYVALAEHLGADFLTDDHRLADSPTFPGAVSILRLPARV